MQKQILDLYNTKVYIFEYDGKDSAEDLIPKVTDGLLRVENIVLRLEETMKMTELLNGEVMKVPATRKRGIKYGEGFDGEDGLLERFVIVVGEDLDEKQMLNIFLSLKVKEALVSTTPIAEVTDMDKVTGSILDEHIDASDIGGVNLGDGEWVVGTISMNDIIEEPKPKKKKRK